MARRVSIQVIFAAVIALSASWVWAGPSAGAASASFQGQMTVDPTIAPELATVTAPLAQTTDSGSASDLLLCSAGNVSATDWRWGDWRHDWWGVHAWGYRDWWGDGSHCGSQVPEPGSVILLTAGLGALIYWRRRR